MGQMAKARKTETQAETAWHVFFRRVRELTERLDIEEQATCSEEIARQS